MIRRLVPLLSIAALGACSDDTEVDLALADVPAAALAAAQAEIPGFTLEEAEAEVRGGTDYLDLEGTRPDGSEVELDLRRVGEDWRVVEIQRDIAFADVPRAVVAALPQAVTGEPVRVIESVQTDGGIVYEMFYGADRVKHEVLVRDGTPEYLTEEWER